MANPKEGEPIWVESLLTPQEHMECARKYTTYTKGSKPVPMFECEFKWRYRMGAGMNPAELQIFNKRVANLARILQEAKEKAEKNDKNK